jgi:hypothetical protein
MKRVQKFCKTQRRQVATIKRKDQERKLTTKITKNTRELSIINDELLKIVQKNLASSFILLLF